MIRVYASASIGNISVGFDVLGLSILPIDGIYLGDSVSIEHSDFFKLINRGKYFHELPMQIEKNIVYQSWKRFCDFLDQGDIPVSIFLDKNVPISSGLGSSACSIVATLVGMNAYCGYPLNKNQLLKLMAEMEEKVSGELHFDNIAPCFLGGMQIILQENDVLTQRVPIFSDWLWVIAYPGVKISTFEARSILPMQYTRDVCITHSRYLSGFIHACYTGQESLAVKLMQDIIAEPYRAQLFPNFFSIRKDILSIGALMCGISGSGSTLFGLSNREDVAFRIAHWFSKYYLKNSEGFVHICRLNLFGARILEE